MDPLMEDSGAGELDDEALEKQLLQELLEWSGKGAAGDMRARLGKPMPEDGGELGAEGLEDGGGELPPEDPEIPGVEAVPAGEGGEGAGGGMDMEKLKAALARMKG